MGNEEQARYWSEVAPGWVEAEKRTELVGGAPGRLAMDRLDLRPGLRLLDIGCGTGGTTVELVRRTFPGGEAVGVDIARGMLGRARQRAENGSVAFVHGDVQQLDLGAGSFDAAFS